ncbi:MAG: hypothetical protein HON90_13140 [Halobacteriovoraceae bacterium]|nr:hypothetical protein [Halobacteriovoraceae bacterium]
MISNRHIQSNIKSSYNKSKSETPYAYKVDADIDTLKNVDNEAIQSILTLFEPYPEALKELSFGSHKIEANAKVKIDVYAFAYGITNKLTAYIGMPIYDAKVKVRYKKLSENSNKKVSEILQKKYGDDMAQTLGNMVENFYTIDETVIQSAIVNSLGYKELGDWSGQGLGDTEIGLKYNIINKKRYGVLTSFGAVAPTGYVDDPDLIQDIGFGDGQWDVFFELGSGYHLSDNLIFNSWGRYTHQFESKKKLRVPFSEKIEISGQKQTFNEKLGNKTDLGIDLEFIATDWLTFRPAISYSTTEKANYKSNNSAVDSLLEENSNSYSQNFMFQTQLSSVNLYLKNKFILPAQLNFSYQTMIEGRNTPKVDLYDIEFRMFF